MNSFKHLDQLADFWIANKMPLDQVLYLSDAEMGKTNEFLTKLGLSDSVVVSAKYPESEHGAIVTKIHYRGYRINIVNIDSLP